MLDAEELWKKVETLRYYKTKNLVIYLY